MSQPIYALSLFFHIVATVIWLGGLALITILVIPEVRRLLETQPEYYRLLSRLRTRFYPISNLSLVVLITTGMFQMSSDPNYDGLMQFNNAWSQVMLLKHLAIVGMVVAGSLLQFAVAPALERTSLLLERKSTTLDEWRCLHRREVGLTWVILLLGVLVLACSAWAVSL